MTVTCIKLLGIDFFILVLANFDVYNNTIIVAATTTTA